MSRDYGDPRERILRQVQVEESTGCWIWQGAVNKDGYGKTYLDGQRLLAHRAVWLLLRGPLPKGLSACHHCDTPRCCNPDHIFFGTTADNLGDAARKGRLVRGSACNLAKLNEEQVGEIRQLALAGATHQKIADTYGLTRTAIGQVVRRDTWKHVP